MGRSTLRSAESAAPGQKEENYMITLSRREVLGTLSAERFSQAKKLLASSSILCDYSIIYCDHTGRPGEMHHLYVREADYGKARRVLAGLAE